MTDDDREWDDPNMGGVDPLDLDDPRNEHKRDDPLTITVAMDPEHPRYVVLRGDYAERDCYAALLPTVVGSNCIRALSGNKHARHIGDWPSPELQRQLAQIKAESGEYPRVL